MNPLQESSLRETARLLAVLGGKEAAETWLAEQVTRFPHHLPLRQLRLEWLRSHPAELALAEVEQYLAVEPRDAWALREKALILLRARRPEDALAPAQLAETIDPRTPGSAGIVGQVLLALRRFEEAQRATERALRHSIDADWLFSQLLATCRSFEEKKAAVQFLAQELRTQASLGSGFLTFVDVATGVLAPDELANLLESLRGDQARHWQVWAACIQQMLATAKLDAALSLAEEATQRFPLLPRLWVELAEVHQARGNLELEINALERARDMSPAWCLPRIRLAGAYLRAGRVRDVGTTLQEGLRHDPMDPQLTLEHARYLWQASQPEEALQAIEKAISLAPSYSFAWALLQQWSREMRKPERVIETARRLVRDRAGDPDPLWRLAQELGGAKKFNEALSCVDRAIALDSTHVQSHDYRAVVLCDLGRYEDALASCRPAEFGKDIPRELRAREAWVYWLAGNPTQAVTLIRSVLETHPDFSWGWQLLADWLEAQGKMKEAADAAERLAALNPGSAFPLGYIGDLRLKAGEKAKAADAFRRALRIDPGYLFGAFSLLQIACEESAWAEVESVMLLVRHHASRWHALRAEVLVFRWKKDREAADAAMRELLKAPTHETNALLGAAGFYHDAGWAARLVSVIERAWSDPEINDEAGAIWVNACRAAGKSAPVGKLMKSSAKHGVKHAALSVHVEQLAGEDARIRMTLLLWKHRDFLRKSTRTWASIGYVLAQFRKHARLIDWMRDWEHRPDLEAWMLYYLTAAYFERGSDAQAEQIVRRALLLPADRCRPIFVAWSAYYSALRGEYAAAAKTLEMFDAPEDFLASKALAEISRQLISVGKASAEERVRAFAAARRSMGRLKADNPAAYDVGYVKRAHQIALRKMATQADAAFWRLWYRLPPLG
jgi:cellulose synthase operon protein C